MPLDVDIDYSPAGQFLFLQTTESSQLLELTATALQRGPFEIEPFFKMFRPFGRSKGSLACSLGRTAFEHLTGTKLSLVLR